MVIQQYCSYYWHETFDGTPSIFCPVELFTVTQHLGMIYSFFCHLLEALNPFSYELFRTRKTRDIFANWQTNYDPLNSLKLPLSPFKSLHYLT